MKSKMLVFALLLSGCSYFKLADDSYHHLKKTEVLSDYVNQKIRISGKISAMPWQHMINSPDGYPNFQYFDYNENQQTVVYSKTPIDCANRCKIWGTVIEIQGSSKRPGSKEIHTEYHIIADRWTCSE